MKKLLLASTLLLTLSASLPAEEKWWIGGDGLWSDPDMWEPAGVPAATDDVYIEDGICEYVPGGDFDLRGSLTVANGGKWVQTGGNAWFKLSGALIIDEGTFDMGTSEKFHGIGDNSSITMTGGTFRYGVFPTDYATAWKSVSISGGGVDAYKEFQFRGTQDLAFNVTTPLISAQSGDSCLNLVAGHLIITGTTYNGFYGMGGSQVNFPADTTAVLSWAGKTVENTYSSLFSGATPAIFYDGAAVSADDFAALFEVVASSDVNGVDIYLKREVAGTATFVDGACGAVLSDENWATFSTAIDDPGSPAATVFLCWGTTNGGQELDAWQQKVQVDPDATGANYSLGVGLTADSVWYYRFAAVNDAGVAFAFPNPSFVMTAAPSVTAATNAIPEDSLEPLQLVFSRPAGTTAPTLNVPFTVSGTAVDGTHYTLSAASPAVIPAGSRSATVALTPIPDWFSDTVRTVTVTIDPSANYLTPSGEGASVTVTLLDAELPAAPTNTFVGVVSSDGADPQNWSLLHTPTATEIVLFSPRYAQRELIWPASITEVAGWVQSLPYPDETFSVTFETTPAAPLRISGDVVLDAGIWTHSGPSETPTTAVAISIGGDLTIASGVHITAGLDTVNKAYGRARGYYYGTTTRAGFGPGYVLRGGASYGGESATNDVTYGSVLNPLSYGSAGYGDNEYYSGAGLIVLSVGGTTTLNGDISAIGFCYDWSDFCGSSGGTINLTTGRLAGNGTFRADGGFTAPSGAGSGGRIRVKLTDASATFDDFTGTISAKGQNALTNKDLKYPGSAAGTIALQTAADAADAALVVVSNPAYLSDLSVIAATDDPGVLATNLTTSVRCTHLPPRQGTDPSFRRTRWELRDHADLRVTADVLIESLAIPSADARVYLDGHVLRTKAFSIGDTEYKAGTYTAVDLPNALVGEGYVIVLPGSTLILLR